MSVADFHKLLRLLEQEFSFQEKLLVLLSKERAAIIGLKQDDLERLQSHKASVIEGIQSVGEQRTLLSEKIGQSKDVKLAQILAVCGSPDLRKRIGALGTELKGVALRVRELNTENGELLKQSLGLVSSTIAIMRSAPGTDLPTYNGKGALLDDEDPAFTARRAGVTREA